MLGAGAAFGVDHENSDDEQGKGSQQDVGEDFPDWIAARKSCAEGEGDGHADDEEKCGENQIDEGHSAAFEAVAEMFHPPGDVLCAGDVVDVDHGEDDQATEGVDGGDSRGERARIGGGGVGLRRQ